MPTIKVNETLAIHILAVYQAMKEDSIAQDGQQVYVGRLSQLVQGLGISSTYYSRIFRSLYQGGYALLEDRGGRNKPSTVILLREPTRDDLLGLTTSDSGPILSLVKRLDSVEFNQGGVFIPGVLKEIDRRLTALEESEATRRGNGKTKK